MTKVGLKHASIELRRAGHSYNFIASHLGVSKGTLSVWLAEVPYTPNAQTQERIGRARAASGAAKNRVKLESFSKAREEALQEIGRMSARDLFMLGLGLYIGEGSKSTDQTRFVNSNPLIICTMIRWFLEAVGLDKKNLRIRLHVYPDCDISKSEQHWSQSIDIPQKQFYKTIVDWRKDKKAVKWGKLPHGTAHLIVNSGGEKRFGVYLARKIHAYSEEVLNTNNFAGVV